MKPWFSLSLLVLSVFYFTYGIYSLDLLTFTGRLGPGFFPFVVGISLVVLTSYNTILAFKEKKTVLASGVDDNESGFIPCSFDVLYLVLTVGLFILLLNVLGGLLAMLLFNLSLLAVFNKGAHLKNISFSIGISLAVYGLFEIWLKAGLPEGILGL
ncbi:tripartite tricarboxylate transporter TctB family protein [Saccharospirillum alexandrii]|uniref:tripartite tricarboxylate transporter TctB family protein n=1 Tax=Saccharospirillum alexandrii TaxID=2448477 RepID=UPI000FDC998B|nr:tripartite tricarboxylate transporter TctB family protein [Saccharospirillum alexandrii]